MSNRPPAPRRRARLTVVAAALSSALVPALLSAGPASGDVGAAAGHPPGSPGSSSSLDQATNPSTSAEGNPLAGEWGVYKGMADGAYPAYKAASGDKRDLLAKVALAPRVRWYGFWVETGKVADLISADIKAEQNGDPDVIVPIAVFREFPHGGDSIHEEMSEADRDEYKRWIDQAAKGIGNSRVLMILEPDLPKALKGWRPDLRLPLVAYAAKVFGSLPNTTTYLDAGAVDWRTVADATDLMVRTGVEHIRGFVVGGTHYTGPSRNIRYGNEIRKALAERGIPDRHFVVDTADNGHPFTFQWYADAHPGGDFNNAEVCTGPEDDHCVALGIPPGPDVDNPRYGFSDRINEIARNRVDGFVWEARPWLNRTKQTTDVERTVAIAQYSPW